MTTYYFVSSLPLPYGIRVTTITWLRTTLWAACPWPTAYALLLLHDYVLLCEQPALALRHTRYYSYITTYYCVSSLPLPYFIRVTTITTYYRVSSLPLPYGNALLLIHYYVLLCEQLALALRHTRYYYYMTTYYCVSSLPLPYLIRVTWLRTTVWAACPCPTSYALLLLHYYVLLCEQLALARRHMSYYYYITKYYCVSSLHLPYGISVTTITYYCVSSLLLPYGIRVTTIKWLRTTVWAVCLCPTVLLCEQPSLALRHTRYYYYMTMYYCVRSLPLSYGIHVTTITWLRTTVWEACPCPTAYALLLLHDYYYSVSSLPLPYFIRVTTITLQRTTVWAACPCPMAYALLLLHGCVQLCEQLALALRHTRYYYYMTVWAACPCLTACALLLLHHYVLLCEQLALALRHACYYYYITTYYCVSSLLLPYGIRVTTIKWLCTTVWAACPCPTAYALLLLHD